MIYVFEYNYSFFMLRQHYETASQMANSNKP